MSKKMSEKYLCVACERVGAYDRICKPMCRMSELACRLAGQDHLTDDQVKILELMGYIVEDLNDTNTNQNGD